MRIKQELLTYKASINLRTECSEREKSCGVNPKKISNSKLFHNLRCEFYLHLH
jgi:hypothetical protein